MRRVLICGSRTWTDPAPIQRVIDGLDPSDTIVITGGARGADQIAAHLAARRGIHVAEVKALWGKYSNAAGPLRNAAMRALEPHEVHAFHQGNSPGTKDMIEALDDRVTLHLHTP